MDFKNYIDIQKFVKYNPLYKRGQMHKESNNRVPVI